MNRSQQNEMMFHITINNELIIGAIAFPSDIAINRILSSLKKIKLLTLVKEENVKYFNAQNKQIYAEDTFREHFDCNLPINHVRLLVPEGCINIEEERNKLYLYREKREIIKSQKVKKSSIEVDDLTVNLEQMYDEREFIKQQKHLQKYIGDEKLKQIVFKYLHQIQKRKEISKILIDLLNKILNRQKDESFQIQSLQNLFSSQNDDQEKQQLLIFIQKIKQFNKMNSEQKQSNKSRINLLNKKIEKIQVQLQKWQQQKIKYFHEKVRLQIQIKQHENDYQKYCQMLQILKSQNNELKSQNSQLIIKQSELSLQNHNFLLQINNIKFQKNKAIQDLQINLNKQKIKIKQTQYIVNYYRYFMDKSLLIYSILSKQSLQQSFLKHFLECMKNIDGIKLIFNFQKMKKINQDKFHQQINYKQNILLIAKTTEGKLLGGYSNVPFAPKNNKCSYNKVKSFLFNIENDQMNIFPIKDQRASVEYDQRYIIFGNEQICINRITGQMNSLLVNFIEKSLHYSDPFNKRQSFLSDKGEITKIKLLNYQLYQIQEIL